MANTLSRRAPQYSPDRAAEMLDGYHYVKGAVEREGGDVIFAHDPEVFKAHKQSPEYYE